MDNNNIQQGLRPGTILRDNTYRIEKVIGQGGFGITYLATDLNLELKVAIKEFFPKDYCDREGATSHVTLGTRSTEEFVDRLKVKFLKEARNIAKFKNPSIIRILAAFEENNTAYYVMEYIEGSTLSEMVKRSGPLAPEQALEYIGKVGGALEYIHAKKINHLDVKPANIMVRASDNEPILIDFGLSKQYDREGHQTSTTPTGISHGYAPMEQYKAGGVKEFSPQTDLYSLAATLYYILTGVVPPQAPELVDESLTFPDTMPPSMIGAISKAMSSGRKHRHESVRAFLDDLKPKPREESSDTVIVGPEEKDEAVTIVNVAVDKKPETPAKAPAKDVVKKQEAAAVKPEKKPEPPKKSEPEKKPEPSKKSEPEKKPEAEKKPGQNKNPQPEKKSEVAAGSAVSTVAKPSVPQPAKKGGWKSWYTYCITAGCVVVAGLIFILFALPGKNDKGALSDTAAVAETVATEAASGAESVKLTVSNTYWDSPLGPASYSGTVANKSLDNGEAVIPDGMGVAKIVSGKYKDCVYDGEFVNGNMQGQTTYTCKNGDVFKGSFSDNTYGNGRYTLAATGDYFVGDFKDSQPYKGDWYNSDGQKVDTLNP